MSLKDLIRREQGATGQDGTLLLFETFGVTHNPFPPAGSPSGHPHRPTAAEQAIEGAIVRFHRDRVSQVLLVEGTQGVGKTNLLSHIQHELEDIYADDKAFYIIRYYPDPEATFDGVIRKVVQELGEARLLERLAAALANMSDADAQKAVDASSSSDMKRVMSALMAAAKKDEEEVTRVSSLAMDWLLGMRLLKSHTEVLKVHFRLDTVESKTQALRDLVFCSAEYGLLRGIFLLLDELEKQDYSISKVMVLRYLSAIRALIDALPEHLFMLVALTTEAKRRYFAMLPAFAGRLQNSVMLQPLLSDSEAVDLATFYFENARSAATRDFSDKNAGQQQLLSPERIQEIYTGLRKTAAARGLEGVSQRDFLNSLNEQAEAVIARAK